jgi:hypothetical protein
MLDRFNLPLTVISGGNQLLFKIPDLQLAHSHLHLLHVNILSIHQKHIPQTLVHYELFVIEVLVIFYHHDWLTILVSLF